ncbi:ATPase, T2SS/T4P/T4SS family [Haloarcula litorea]|uniref:ATPase, T2SS/T4P/T4SS family n=1 Tax=Haloarcula litorea TaxID=3032579 RepID=UPI0023E88396|nr:ATPase, T2SS/T4P/T4SS family [Halomicroarcula sp. GDY20]
MLERFTGDDASPACRCEFAREGDRLAGDAADCPGDGLLHEEADCRAAAVAALDGADADAVVTRAAGRERAYLDGAAALLVAAGRFAARTELLDERLAERARRAPLAAAREATGRADRVAEVAAETGLAVAAEGVDGETPLAPHVRPTVSDAWVAATPPADGTLRDRRSVETGATVRRYGTPGDGLDVYHLRPREHEFDDATTAALADAVARLASGPPGETPSPEAAAAAATADGEAATAVAAVLRKHTQGLGVVEDLFADPRVSDVFATAPVAATRLRVRADGETLRTNVRLSERGARALASAFRRRSGRAFSRASPTLDATATVAGRRVRVAGVTDPVSDGVAFAFRAHDERTWRLADLVANGTVPPPVAGLLSVAVERGAACLVAGPRGAGKTTTLGALLWELPRAVRTVVIEDTPELPVSDLQGDGRDVQALRTASGDGPAVDASEALRTALRLGEGALVVGEVRGGEAAVLYEAMRVGDGDSAVLGTIHGTGGDSVRERLVADLGVPPSSFGATDLIATLAPPSAAGGRGIASVEEVVDGDDSPGFAALFERDGETATATGRLQRGASHLVESLADPVESYADVLDGLADRTERFETVATESGAASSPPGATGR